WFFELLTFVNIYEKHRYTPHVYGVMLATIRARDNFIRDKCEVNKKYCTSPGPVRAKCLAMFVVRKSTNECQKSWVWLCGCGDVNWWMNFVLLLDIV
ncbi:25331_t:CDS:2, partial [Dentiscutata erythropus]